MVYAALPKSCLFFLRGKYTAHPYSGGNMRKASAQMVSRPGYNYFHVSPTAAIAKFFQNDVRNNGHCRVSSDIVCDRALISKYFDQISSTISYANIPMYKTRVYVRKMIWILWNKAASLWRLKNISINNIRNILFWSSMLFDPSDNQTTCWEQFIDIIH